MEDQGLLVSEWNVEGPRPRRYYVISPEGSQILADLTKEWRELTAVMENLLAGETGEGE
jgi:DNA-binding PadR family transcriptional regulator